MVDYYREYQLEMERHRKTWTQLEQVKGLLRDCRWRIVNKDTSTDDYKRLDAPVVERIDAALSQQTEPVCRCTMRERTVGDGCSVCNPEYAANHETEQAPAQDELIPRNQAIAEAFREGVEWQRTRPAQTEQQPVAIPEAVRAWMMDVPLPDNEYGYRLTNRRDELLAALAVKEENKI